MSKEKAPPYSAEFKARAVKLAIESDQPIAHTARDLGVNESTMHTWISKSHEGGDRPAGRASVEHLDDELQRLRKENALLKEERDLLQKAAAYFAANSR